MNKEISDKICQACEEASNSLLSLAEKIKEAFDDVQPVFEKTIHDINLERATMGVDMAKELDMTFQQGYDYMTNCDIRRVYQDGKMIQILRIARDGEVTDVSTHPGFEEEMEEYNNGNKR